MTPLRFVLTLTAVLFTLDLQAADPTYWQDVRPLLRKHCTVCHSERRLDEPDVSAGLALDSLENILKKRKSQVMVPGQPDRSSFITLLTSKDAKRAMPLDADPLEASEIAMLRKWVEIGAPEGTKPADDGVASIAVPVAKFRKLPVGFATKTVLPKASSTPGALELKLPIGPLPPIAAVAFSPDGKLLAVGIYGRVTLWNLATGQPSKVLTNVLGAVNDLKFSPDGKLLAVAGGQPSARGDLRLFDTTDWKLLASLGGHKDVVSCVSFAPDGKKLASASFDKTVRLWDITNTAAAKVLHTFSGHSDFVYAVAFAPDGTWYATASKDNSGRGIDAKTGQGKFTFSGTDLEVLAVAFTPQGDQLVTSGLNPQLQWWDAKTGEKIKAVAGPTTATYELGFSPKGRLGIAAGGDRTARLIDTKTQGVVRPLPHGAVVFAAALEAKGEIAATGGADGVVKLWKTEDATPIATLWSGAGEGEFGAWLALAPAGYYAGSEATLAKAAWLVAGKPAEAATVATLKNPDLVAKSIAGQPVPDIGGKSK